MVVKLFSMSAVCNIFEFSAANRFFSVAIRISQFRIACLSSEEILNTYNFLKVFFKIIIEVYLNISPKLNPRNFGKQSTHKSFDYGIQKIEKVIVTFSFWWHFSSSAAVDILCKKNLCQVFYRSPKPENFDSICEKF